MGLSQQLCSSVVFVRALWDIGDWDVEQSPVVDALVTVVVLQTEERTMGEERLL